ncbi:histone acetyltransferase [Ranunculus cassubicifolius]
MITQRCAKEDKSKDLDLMEKFRKNINGKSNRKKENFIVVHLQYVCSHCRQSMIHGSRWMCNVCEDFQLCDQCHGAEQRSDEAQRHPLNGKDKHNFSPVEIRDVPVDTTDGDEIFERKFLETRSAFIKLCEGNHYQFDTLRRAKHSSMMILYHLHNPSAPAFATECSVCNNYVDTGQGWRCGTCADYEMCDPCFQKDRGVSHPHELTKHSFGADSYGAQDRESRREILTSLVHASMCKLAGCIFPNCRKIKALFHHGVECKTRARGGCLRCKQMWYLLQLHARICKDLKCCVPRCKDLREHTKRLQCR